MADKYRYGGQAVIEGVMMRGRDYLAVAVRRKPGDVVVHKEPVGGLTKRFAFLRLPFIRGMVMLFDSLILGMKAIIFSANQFVEEEQQGKLTPLEMTLMIAMAAALSIVLFVLLPLGARGLIGRWTAAALWLNLAEGAVRACILVLYMLAVSLLPDMRRIFAYHGAEHKVINAYEANEELTVANAQRYTTQHPRCGTSFLLYVVLVSAIVFTLLGRQTIIMRIASRILLLPVVAGLSYELLRLAGKRQGFFLMRWLSAPGMWLQKISTRQPDDEMVAVAITALQEVLALDKRAAIDLPTAASGAAVG